MDGLGDEVPQHHEGRRVQPVLLDKGLRKTQRGGQVEIIDQLTLGQWHNQHL
jgi:hypothetical protein